MKKKKLLLSLWFGLLSYLLLIASVALAGSVADGQPPVVARHGYADGPMRTMLTGTVTLTGSVVITPTDPTSPTVIHPVASAMAEHYQVSYDEIAALHEAGLGFGVIAKMYSMAAHLEGVTPEMLQTEFETGMGWGEIARAHQLKPGQGYGVTVGDIMSGRASVSEVLNHRAGFEKPDKEPPGRAKKAGDTEVDEVQLSAQPQVGPPDQEAGQQPGNQGQGNGNNGNPQDKGKDKDKDKETGEDKDKGKDKGKGKKK